MLIIQIGRQKNLKKLNFYNRIIAKNLLKNFMTHTLNGSDALTEPPTYKHSSHKQQL